MNKLTNNELKKLAIWSGEIPTNLYNNRAWYPISDSDQLDMVEDKAISELQKKYKNIKGTICININFSEKGKNYNEDCRWEEGKKVMIEYIFIPSNRGMDGWLISPEGFGNTKKEARFDAAYKCMLMFTKKKKLKRS